MSDHTKRALADSLKKQLTKKSLEKVTITDLTDDCHLNRQTFYYHFQDIYDLISWMYVSTAQEAIGKHKTYATWQEGMLDMCRIMLENKNFILMTYHSRIRDYLITMLHKLSYDLLIPVVYEVARGYNITENQKQFIANFYKYGYAGIIMKWVDDGMNEKPQVIVKGVETLMQGNFLVAVKRFAQEDK